MFRRLFVIAMAAIAMAAVAAPALARPFTAKDLATLDRLSDPHLSPDGRWVAWSVRSTDWDGNKGTHALWLFDRKAKGAAPVRLSEKERSPLTPRWNAAGDLYFLSSRSGTRQLWRTTPSEAGPATEPVQMTSLPVEVDFYRLSADGRTLVFATGAYPDCPDLACGKIRDVRPPPEKASGQVFNETTSRFWDTWMDGKREMLFAAALDPAKPTNAARPLMKGLDADVPSKPDGDDTAFALSPDGAWVWFAARPSGASQGVGDPDSLYMAPTDGSKAPARLEAAAAADVSDSGLALSPDGKTLAFLRQTGPAFVFRHGTIMVRDLQTGAVRQISLGMDRSVDRVAWSGDGRTLYALAGDTGQSRLFAIEVKTGKVAPLTTDGHIGDFDVAGRELVYVRDALDSPGQLFAQGPKGKAVQVSRMSEATLAETPMSPAEQYSFAGWNGETVHGYVVKPTGWVAGRKYPVAFLIHGGPHGTFGNSWSYRWNPQVWTGMGYAVVMVDFHGSSGYGEAFGRSVVGHWGDRPLEDLQKGWASALAKYDWLDGDKACALGGSYGGYMVNWIAGNWSQPWKCLVNHDGVFDNRSMAYSTDIPAFSEVQQGGVTWGDPTVVDRFNPAMYVDSWRVPMLVIHGGRDYRVPLDQGLAAFMANKRKGVPSRLLYYPDENHWVLKPQNSVQWYANVEAWMKQHLGE